METRAAGPYSGAVTTSAMLYRDTGRRDEWVEARAGFVGSIPGILGGGCRPPTSPSRRFGSLRV